MKNARQENRENYLVFVQCGSDQMGCGDRSSDICTFLRSAQQYGNWGSLFDHHDPNDCVDQGRYEKQQESWWKYKAASRYGMWLVMLVGAVTACVAMNDIVMLMNMQRISQIYQSTEQIIYSAPRWLQLAGAGILAPVAEELVYRGMIYRRMRESLTAVQAGVFVSILFGVGHGNLPQGLYAMVLGLLLACIYEKFRNIAAPILFHIVVNITSLLLSWYGGFEWILGTEGKAVGITVLATLITVIIYVKIKNIRQEIR